MPWYSIAKHIAPHSTQIFKFIELWNPNESCFNLKIHRTSLALHTNTRSLFLCPPTIHLDCVISDLTHHNLRWLLYLAAVYARCLHRCGVKVEKICSSFFWQVHKPHSVITFFLGLPIDIPVFIHSDLSTISLFLSSSVFVSIFLCNCFEYAEKPFFYQMCCRGFSTPLDGNTYRFLKMKGN